MAGILRRWGPGWGGGVPEGRLVLKSRTLGSSEAEAEAEERGDSLRGDGEGAGEVGGEAARRSFWWGCGVGRKSGGGARLTGLTGETTSRSDTAESREEHRGGIDEHLEYGGLTASLKQQEKIQRQNPHLMTQHSKYENWFATLR